MQVAARLDVVIRDLGSEGSPPDDLTHALDRRRVVLLLAKVETGLPARESDLAFLHAAERDRCDKLATPALARRFAYSRWLLRESIAAIAQCAPIDVQIGVNEHGKPLVKPASPGASIHFSIGHSGDRLAIALSRMTPVGVDIERLRPVADWDRIAERALTASERSELRRAIAAGDDPNATLLRHWCRIEAAYKAVGIGLPSITSSPGMPRPTSVVVVDLPTGLEESSRASFAPSYCGAVGVLSNGNEIVHDESAVSSLELPGTGP